MNTNDRSAFNQTKPNQTKLLKLWILVSIDFSLPCDWIFNWNIFGLIFRIWKTIRYFQKYPIVVDLSHLLNWHMCFWVLQFLIEVAICSCNFFESRKSLSIKKKNYGKKHFFQT